jgi:hypothetical protein
MRGGIGVDRGTCQDGRPEHGTRRASVCGMSQAYDGTQHSSVKHKTGGQTAVAHHAHAQSTQLCEPGVEAVSANYIKPHACKSPRHAVVRNERSLPSTDMTRQ